VDVTPRGSFARSNLGQLREGMTRAEVEAILGAPGDYSTGPLEFVGQPRSVRVEPSRESHGTDGSTYLQWADDTRFMGINFDAASYLEVTTVCPVRRVAAQGPLDNLLWRAPSASGTAGSRSRPCAGGRCSWCWRVNEFTESEAFLDAGCLCHAAVAVQDG
jgi:hypothetical protein